MTIHPSLDSHYLSFFLVDQEPFSPSSLWWRYSPLSTSERRTSFLFFVTSFPPPPPFTNFYDLPSDRLLNPFPLYFKIIQRVSVFTLPQLIKIFPKDSSIHLCSNTPPSPTPHTSRLTPLPRSTKGKPPNPPPLLPCKLTPLNTRHR